MNIVWLWRARITNPRQRFTNPRQRLNFDGKIPNEITVEDKSLLEQVKLIAELEPEEKNMVFKMIDTFLTKKKFKDFFTKNIAAL